MSLGDHCVCSTEKTFLHYFQDFLKQILENIEEVFMFVVEEDHEQITVWIFP